MSFVWPSGSKSERRSQFIDSGNAPALFSHKNQDAGRIDTSASGEPAVDNQTVPGHKRRPAGTQTQNGAGHLFDPTNTPDGMQGGKIEIGRASCRERGESWVGEWS